jgi:hypothetical protein
VIADFNELSLGNESRTIVVIAAAKHGRIVTYLRFPWDEHKVRTEKAANAQRAIKMIKPVPIILEKAFTKIVTTFNSNPEENICEKV